MAAETDVYNAIPVSHLPSRAQNKYVTYQMPLSGSFAIARPRHAVSPCALDSYAQTCRKSFAMYASDSCAAAQVVPSFPSASQRRRQSEDVCGG